MNELAFAQRLPLPLEALTQTFALLGKRGSGKTYAALRLAESMLEAHGQVVCLDPIGKHWSLRLAADGRGAGFELPVFGGHHGDLPLEPGAGALIADLVVDKGISCVLDVSLMSKGGRRTFATAFGEQLEARKKAQRAPTPIHLIIEESQLFVPQRVPKGEERMLGAYENLVRLGRNFGIGATLVSQRPQSVNKEVLSQTEVLIALQTISPHERAAIREWFRSQDEERLGAVNDLPSLEVGECIISSPGWLRTFQRTRIRKRVTFDASATPKPGAARKAAAPRKLADTELEQLRASMAEVVERAAADDPRALRKRIAELERELRAAGTAGPSPEDLERARAEGTAGARRQLAETVRGLAGRQEQSVRVLERVLGDLAKLADLVREPIEVDLDAEAPPAGRPAIARPRAQREAHLARPALRSESDVTIAGRRQEDLPPLVGPLTGPEQRILDALAWLESCGIPCPFSRTQVAFVAGYSPKSSAFANTLSSARTKGLIDYPTSGMVAATDEGAAVGRGPEAAPSREDLHARVMGLLSGPQRRVLEPLLAVWPEDYDREQLAELAGYSPTSSAFANTVSSLRTLGLLEYPTFGMARASDVLFPALRS